MRAWRDGGDTGPVGEFPKRTRRQLRSFGIAFSDGQLVCTQGGVAEIRPVAGVRASVLAATDEVSLVVQGPDFEWVVPCRPADRSEARRLSAEINNASHQLAADEAFWAALPR